MHDSAGWYSNFYQYQHSTVLGSITYSYNEQLLQVYVLAANHSNMLSFECDGDVSPSCVKQSIPMEA